jgi:hypothetical protein
MTKGMAGRPVRRAHPARKLHKASINKQATAKLAAKTAPAKTRNNRIRKEIRVGMSASIAMKSGTEYGLRPLTGA